MKLPGYLELLEQLRESPLRALAKTLTSWMEPVIATWRFSKTNGITEGFHNKMEMISRRAFGFRNFENYRLRVLTHCEWDAIIIDAEGKLHYSDELLLNTKPHKKVVTIYGLRMSGS